MRSAGDPADRLARGAADLKADHSRLPKIHPRQHLGHATSSCVVPANTKAGRVAALGRRVANVGIAVDDVRQIQAVRTRQPQKSNPHDDNLRLITFIAHDAVARPEDGPRRWISEYGPEGGSFVRSMGWKVRLCCVTPVRCGARRLRTEVVVGAVRPELARRDSRDARDGNNRERPAEPATAKKCPERDQTILPARNEECATGWRSGVIPEHSRTAWPLRASALSERGRWRVRVLRQ